MSAAWEFDIPIHKVGIDGMEIDQPVPQIHSLPETSTTNNFKKPKGPAPMPYSEKSSRSQRREAAAIGNTCLKDISISRFVFYSKLKISDRFISFDDKYPLLIIYLPKSKNLKDNPFINSTLVFQLMII